MDIKRKTISTVEASEMYGPTAGTFRKLAITGGVPAQKIGPNWYFAIKDLDRMFLGAA